LIPLGTAAKVLEIAIGEIGTIEGPKDNETKYGKFTKFDQLPWCGSFCNWVFAQAKVSIPSMVATAMGAQKLKNIGSWMINPLPGDLVFFDFPHDGVDKISHIGIVMQVNKADIWTIEGNTGGAGQSQRNGGMVLAKVRPLGKGSPVVGYGRPKFLPYSGELPKVTPTDTPTPKVVK
jgi:hypothetical protein